MTHVINILYEGMGFKLKTGLSLYTIKYTIAMTILDLSLSSQNFSNHINKGPQFMTQWTRIKCLSFENLISERP